MKSLVSRAYSKYRQQGVGPLLHSIARRGTLNLILRAKSPVVIEDIQDGAITQADLQKWAYNNRETIEIGVPEPPSEPMWTERSRSGTYTLPTPFVCEIRDCRVVTCRTERGDLGRVLIDRDGNIVIETETQRQTLEMNLDQLLYESGIRAVVRTLFFSKEDVIFDAEYDLAVPLIGRMCMNFGHWFQQYLPSLRGVEAYEQRTGETPLILLNPDPPQWMRDSLRMVGYSNEDWSEISGDNIKIDRTILPSQQWQYIGRQDRKAEWGTTFAQAFSRHSLNWVRNRALDHVSEMDITRDFSENVYISRTHAESRRVVNEDELMDSLAEYGFERYTLSDLSLFEQVELFHGANSVVGPIGSGFTNILYANDANVLVISAGDTDNGLTMSEALGHDFACMRCDYEEIPGSDENENLLNQSDLHVNVSELIAFMEDFGMVSGPTTATTS